MNNKEIGKYLLKKRKEKGLTQSDLANELNVTYQAVSRWENGDSIPDIQMLDSLATYYNVSVDTILQRNSDQNRHDISRSNNTVRRNVSILMSTVFVVFNALGISLFIIFGYSSNGNGFMNAIAIICLIMFGLVAHISYNVYYFMFTKKNLTDTKRYVRSYLIFTLIIIICTTILFSFILVPVIVNLTAVVSFVVYSFIILRQYAGVDSIKNYLGSFGKPERILILLMLFFIVFDVFEIIMFNI